MDNGRKLFEAAQAQEAAEVAGVHKRHVLATIGGATIVGVILTMVIGALIAENNRLKTAANLKAISTQPGFEDRFKKIDARLNGFEIRLDAGERAIRDNWKKQRGPLKAEPSGDILFGPGGEAPATAPATSGVP